MTHDTFMQLPDLAVMESGSLNAPGVGVRRLTAQIADGSEDAFNHFYAEFSPRIFRFLIVVTAGDEELSRELHQSVMITAAQKLKEFETEEALWAWLAQVARNKWKDVCRKRTREERLLSVYSVDNDDHTSRNERVNEALRALTGPERDLVETFYFDDLPQKEIARSSGRTVKAIGCALARIRQKLKRLLKTRP